MTEESKQSIPPFHQRFSVQVNLEYAQERFINRIINGITEHYEELERSLMFYPWKEVSLQNVASTLGKRYDSEFTFSNYVEKNFHDCLLALEGLYKVFFELKAELPVNRYELDGIIEHAITLSETDLGIEWRDGVFWPSGAKLLDEALVNENLKWLSDRGYSDVLTPFEKGMLHYLEAHRQPEKLADTVTDIYESFEALAKVVTGKDRDLSGNAELFISKVKLNEYYKKLLKDYIDYACEYRHAVKLGRKRKPLSRNEVEAFFYTTGLFIRLSIQQLASQEKAEKAR